MLALALKCDCCHKAVDPIVSSLPKIPEGWASIVPLIHIKGTPKTGDRIKRADNDKRRALLKEAYVTIHLCPVCISRIINEQRQITCQTRIV